MEVLGLASMVPVPFKTRFQGVSRNLNELNDEDKHAVIYEIARIDTMLSALADHDGPFCPI